MKKYLSAILCAALVLCCIPFTGFAESSASGAVYKIFVADPSRQGDEGTDVTAVSAGSGYFSSDEKTVTATEENDRFYRTVYSYGDGKGLYNRASYFKSDKTNSTGGFSWMGEIDQALKALAGYVTVSYKVRAVQSVVSGNADSDGKIYFEFGTANAYTGDNAFASQKNASNVKLSGEWNEFSYTPNSWGNFYSGFFGFKAEPYPDFTGTVTVDIKDITFTVKEEDRQAINKALSEYGSGYTFDKLISNYHYVDTYEEVYTDYTVLAADPDKVTDESGASVKANLVSGASYSPKFDVVKMTDDGSYYRTQMTISGKGGDGFNTVAQTGYTNNVRGYGWLEDTTVLQTLRPYITVSLEYRANAVSGSIPSDGNLYFGAAQPYNGRATSFGSASLSGAADWTKITVKLSGNSFASWYNAYIYCSVYSNSGKFNGSYNIDLRNFKLTLNSADRVKINEALAEAGSLWTFEDLVQSDPNWNTHNVIWYASPERLGAKVGDNVTGETGLLYANKKAKYETVSAYDRGVSFYRTEMQASGKGGDQYNAIIKSGFTSESNGYGWLANKNLLNALRPYMYVSFEYRFTSTATIPSDAYVYYGAASSKGKICSMGAVKGGADEWTECELSVCSADFSSDWSEGYFTVSIYSDSGGFSGTQTLDLRNIRIELRDCDRLAINDALNKVSGISGIENFTKGVIRDRDESGSYSYYSTLINQLPDTEFDANDDGEFDITDIIRIKKLTAGMCWTSNVIRQRLDCDGDGRISSTELASSKKLLLCSALSPYAYDPLKVELVTEHPGVPEADAYYELKVTDENGNSVDEKNVSVTVNNSDVTVSGYALTVPYSVRSSDETLTVTVTDKSDTAVYGRYDFEFIKFTDKPTLDENFDTLNTDLWSEYAASGAYEISDGKLVYTSEAGQVVGFTTKNKFEQAYGSFSASIKMPQKALANGAFWLYSNTGKTYKRNPLNPSISGGEIDIVEYFPTWSGGRKWSSTVHWYGSTDGHHRQSGDDSLTAAADLGDGYHIYSAVWTSEAVYSYLDGVLYRIYNGEGVSDHSDGMQIILSLHGCAEDSSWGGSFNAADFPDTMSTDWIRVYGLAE